MQAKRWFKTEQHSEETTLSQTRDRAAPGTYAPMGILSLPIWRVHIGVVLGNGVSNHRVTVGPMLGHRRVVDALDVPGCQSPQVHTINTVPVWQAYNKPQFLYLTPMCQGEATSTW
jgi:hypothetical protein